MNWGEGEKEGCKRDRFKNLRFGSAPAVVGVLPCNVYVLELPDHFTVTSWYIMQSLSRNVLRATCRTTRPPVLLIRCNHTQPNSGHSPEPQVPPRTTHFGFRTVPEESKESLVKNVFSSVASSYDLMNDAMSMGVHRLWKDDYVSSLKPGRKGPMRCIDLAGGTGDIALRILDYARENYADRETTVDVVDINGEMLQEGYKRFKKTMYHNSKLNSSLSSS